MRGEVCIGHSQDVSTPSIWKIPVLCPSCIFIVSYLCCFYRLGSRYVNFSAIFQCINILFFSSRTWISEVAKLSVTLTSRTVVWIHFDLLDFYMIPANRNSVVWPAHRNFTTNRICLVLIMLFLLGGGDCDVNMETVSSLMYLIQSI